MTSASTITLDIASVQGALRAACLDGWLLYDFRGINPIALNVSGVARQPGHLATRRWFYLIPAQGEPRALVHSIEAHTLAHLPGQTRRYAGREQLEEGLKQILAGLRTIAMEYSPGCAIPYIARVDAGTIELVRKCGVEVVSSGDLVQQFSAVWNGREIASHLAASEKLHRVKDRAFELIAQHVKNRVRTTEYDIQQAMAGWFREEGLVSDSDPNVSVAANAGNPHYLPTPESARPIGKDELVLLDLWAKLDESGSVFADITWVGFTGSRVPEPFVKAFAAVCDARDAALALVEGAAATNRSVHGWEVDRAASDVLVAAGYRDHILHRTGHSLGQSVHGDGVNMDDYETHDDRQLLAGTGFTIEPGLYFKDFGVRSEINVVVHATHAAVSGPRQSEILALGS